MKCNSCHIGTANIDPVYGVLPCDPCKERRRLLFRPNSQVEFTSESIKEQRKEYRTDIHPFHNRGELDKGAIDRYGVEKVKARGFTDSEIKNAKYTWSGIDEYYKSEL